MLVITGAGEDFCSGADVGGDPRDREGHPLDGMRSVGRACQTLHTLPKPTIARVDGVAAGAGLNMALACDFVLALIAAGSARSSLAADSTLTSVARSSSRESLACRRRRNSCCWPTFSTQNAPRRWALSTGWCHRSELDTVVEEFVSKLKAGPPIALATSKKLLNQSFTSTLEEALEAEGIGQAYQFTTADTVEAMMAFVEKRDPLHGPLSHFIGDQGVACCGHEPPAASVYSTGQGHRGLPQHRFGKGSVLTLKDGREILDGMGSLWYCNVGYGHPKVTEAIKSQLDTIHAHHIFDPFTNDLAETLAAEIADRAPMPDSKVFFAQSGSEAVDTALKLARAAQAQAGHPEKTLVVSRTNGYHGTAYGGTSAQGSPNTARAGENLSRVTSTSRATMSRRSLVCSPSGVRRSLR